MRGYREFVTAMGRRLGLNDISESSVVAERDRRAADDAYLPELLASAGVSTLLVDTGFGGDRVISTGELAATASVAVRVVVRVEQIAERVLADRRATATPTRFAAAVSEAIALELDAGAVGMKTIAAYRSGLALAVPPVARVREALADRAAQARRMTDPALEAIVVLAAAELGGAHRIPLQVHAGFGDTDLRLPAADPSLLGDLLRDPRMEACPLVLLHCQPFVPAAAFLAAAYPNVHMDLSLTVPLLGATGAERALAAALELCPATKLLAGTDGHSYPEMHWRGGTLWREALATVLGAEVAQDRTDAGAAAITGAAILSGNARRLYRLPE